MVSAELLLGLVFSISILAVLFAAWLANDLLKRDTGTAGMQQIAEAIREGSEAFVKRQYGTIAIFSVIVAVLLAIVYVYTGKGDLALKTVAGFILGAVCSAIAGIVGMAIAVRANIRTASAARRSVSEALLVALRSGAISGVLVVALTLIGVSSLYYFFGMDPETTPFQIVGYAFGASFVALFAQLGGGIYTKAADVGADLVGKVEAGIPEDDPRNPAVIADLVGDNVGDCAGRGADLFESTAAENIGAMILGVGLFSTLGVYGVLFPLVIGACGLLASMVGILIVRGKENEDPMKALNRGYYVTSVISAILFGLSSYWLLGEHWKPFFYAGLVGLVLAQLFVYITQYYTEHKYRPVKEIAKAGTTGPATVIIQGLAVGFECTALPAICISIALYVSFWLGSSTGLENGGLYGTAVATMGMLSTAAYILAMDNFGPITDNAGGIVEMSNAPKDVRKRTDILDAVGNTTKALTKGYAIGSASLAAFLLFSAYMDEITHTLGTPFEIVNLANLDVFIGALLGAMLVFLFSALAMRAVGKTAGCVIEEVRRQFKKKGIMEGKVKPNYAACVDITTRGALKTMILPGVLAIALPIVVGLLLKYEALAGFLMVGTIVGILMALVMNNAGGAWDNAKKYVETGAYGGKGSDVHKAVVVGDTVGDPFKDTAGPSLHVLIKLLATIALVLAPLFV